MNDSCHDKLDHQITINSIDTCKVINCGEYLPGMYICGIYKAGITGEPDLLCLLDLKTDYHL